ncbi:MAG TPA: peptide-methionine (S)-S-oxide reductase, partial [Bryobacteraceae bacterium]|nr:peptide-methionine (S)-S-oxide reductase [Bryobacteraceae bacterium]
FATHDPTTRDRQGNDVGAQYRSVIFYGSDEQRSTAEKLIRELDAKHIWDDPIVTAVERAATFYRAEDYHQNYFRDNAQQPYCTFVVAPKVRKFREKFAHKLRRSAVQRSH